MNLPKRWIVVPLVKRKAPESDPSGPARIAVINTDKINVIVAKAKSEPDWGEGTNISTDARKLTTSLPMDEVLDLIDTAQGGRAGYYITVPAETVECAESDLSDDSGD